MDSKTAFVTGASRGIGHAIANIFARNGYNLALNSFHSPAILSAVAADLTEKYHITCLPFTGDAGDCHFVEQTFREIERAFCGIDVLINNAGISHMGLLSDMSIAEWHNVLDTNLTSVFNCCKYAIPAMVHKKSGKIINISSIWGNVGASCEVAYAASKGGMNAFTKSLAKELAPSNIQVNAIACGLIDTQMNQFLSDEESHFIKGEIPIGRFGDVNEVADLAYSLSQSSSYLTGQIITLDGGYT
ncbi:SDR family oxidoreductase [Lachnospiraceae bacterium ZAX-1]